MPWLHKAALLHSVWPTRPDRFTRPPPPPRPATTRRAGSSRPAHHRAFAAQSCARPPRSGLSRDPAAATEGLHLRVRYGPLTSLGVRALLRQRYGTVHHDRRIPAIDPSQPAHAEAPTPAAWAGRGHPASCPDGATTTAEPFGAGRPVGDGEAMDIADSQDSNKEVSERAALRSPGGAGEPTARRQPAARPARIASRPRMAWWEAEMGAEHHTPQRARGTGRRSPRAPGTGRSRPAAGH